MNHNLNKTNDREREGETEIDKENNCSLIKKTDESSQETTNQWRPVMDVGFFGWVGSRKCLAGPIFRWGNESLLFDKALEFGIIFHKSALKLINICKIIGKIREKCKFFQKNFVNFLAGNIFFNYKKNKELIWIGYSGRFGSGAARR